MGPWGAVGGSVLPQLRGMTPLGCFVMQIRCRHERPIISTIPDIKADCDQLSNINHMPCEYIRLLHSHL